MCIRDRLSDVGNRSESVNLEPWVFEGNRMPLLLSNFFLDSADRPGLRIEDFDLYLGDRTQLGTNNQQIASAAQAREQPPWRNVPGFQNDQDFDSAERLAGVFDLEVDDRRAQPAQSGFFSDQRQAALQPFQEAMALADIQVRTERKPSDDGDDNHHEDG